MADTKISGMSAAAGLGGTEVFPAVQSGANVKVTVAQIIAAVLSQSSLPSATTLGGAESIAAVQSGTNVKLTVTQLMAAVMALLGDTDITLAGNSDVRLATQKAVKAYVDAGAGIPVRNISAAYTFVLADGNGGVVHPAADTTARIWTIPANATVGYPIGTTITADNAYGAGALTLSIAGSDVLELVGASGATGSRTIATGGQATFWKVAATRWRLNGSLIS